jgi:hypothetical protein
MHLFGLSIHPPEASLQWWRGSRNFWFRDDHPEGQFTRVKNFSCSQGMLTASEKYNNEIRAFLSQKYSCFPQMSFAERNKLRGFLPQTWEELQSIHFDNMLTPQNRAFFMSVIIRETGADPFLEEQTTSRFYLKGGTGLIQMTAIHKFVYGKPVPWAFDDYVSYKEIYEENLPRDSRLPPRVSYNGRKDLRNAQEFIQGAFNPFASCWKERSLL